MITGGCACGAVRYEGQADPGFSFLCQCRSCQHLTGSGHLAQFMYPRAQLKVIGSTASWTRNTASGNTVEKVYCATCASPLYGLASISQDNAMVCAGSLDDPNIFRPAKILFSDEATHWDHPLLPDNNGAST